MEDNRQNEKETRLSENTGEDGLEEAELENVLDSVPPEHRKVIERILISSSVQTRSIASPESIVMKKMTPEHISKYLDGAEQEMKNSYAEKLHKKIFVFLTTIVAMAFFVAIIVLLKDMPETMEKIICTVGGLAAGAFGGYGIGKNKNDD